MENNFELFSIAWECNDYKSLIINILTYNTYSLFKLNISNEKGFVLHEFRLLFFLNYPNPK